MRNESQDAQTDEPNRNDRVLMRNSQIVKTRRTFRTIWGELEYVCAKVHNLWYVKRNKGGAKRYFGRLQRILNELPANDMAILREDPLATLDELNGRVHDAIEHREREIALMQKLHEDVKSRPYTGRLRASILVNRDARALQERRAILRALKKQANRSALQAP